MPTTLPRSTDVANPPRPREATIRDLEKRADRLSGEAQAALDLLQNLQRVVIWDVAFDALTMWQAVDAIDVLIAARCPVQVVTANLHSCMLVSQDAAFRQAIVNAALVLADGHPMVVRSRLMPTPLPQRVAGSDLIDRIASRAALRGYRVFLLGGGPDVALRAGAEALRRYPGLKIVGCESPEFGRDDAATVAAIRAADPDLLLVAAGQPKGEVWIEKHREAMGVPVSIQLGASFDFLAGTARRAPGLFQNLGMEWLHRMASDPMRLVPRYLANGGFLSLALIEDWRRAVRRWGMMP